MTEDLVAYESSVPEMRVARAPEVVMAEAEKAAKVLVGVVSRKPRKVMINNEQYLEFEDWQTVAQFYACTVRVSWTRFLDLGGVRGHEACAEVLDRSGRVLSSAEAMCLNDEERWSTRAVYEWKDGKRTQTGEQAVPLFQLRSMAQTRACAKALRNVFAWVVVLAGYRATPAEEMTGNETNGKGREPPITMPQPVTTDTGPQSVTGIIQAVTSKTGKGKKGDWTKYGVQIEGEWYGTFDNVMGACAQDLKGKMALIEWKQDGEYKTIASIGEAPEPVDQESPSIDPYGVNARIAAMKEIDAELYKNVTFLLGIQPMSLGAVEKVEAEFNRELDKKAKG